MCQLLWGMRRELQGEIMRKDLEHINWMCSVIVQKHWPDVPSSDIVWAVRYFDLVSENEADIQLEVRYTAGADEYGRGRVFDPTLEEQQNLREELQDTIMLMTQKSVGVWTHPHYKGGYTSPKAKVKS